MVLPQLELLAWGFRVTIVTNGIMLQISMKDEKIVKSREIPKSSNRKFVMFERYFTQKERNHCV